jgi:TolB protein
MSVLGYTEYRTNLPTRYDNQITSRACIVGADGKGRRVLAESLAREPYVSTQFAGWSPDGCLAFIGRGWETPENGAWEAANKTFRMTEGWLYDMYLLDMTSGKLDNLTAVERVSDYNTGLFFVPGDANRLGFTALINGISHPFVMDRDGRHKKDLSQGKEGFAYGFSASPDGAFVAYHKDYHIFVANADGANPREIATGNPFNFCPQWSPDGSWLLFVSGEHYNCHPYVAHPDGTGLRKLADRGGYEGVAAVYDVFDFHGGSSDVPVWSTDGACVFFTARVGDAIELMRASLDGQVTQMTQSKPGTRHYHPKPSPDGRRLAFGSNETGTRQLYVMTVQGKDVHPITQVPAGYGAMWPHWRP